MKLLLSIIFLLAAPLGFSADKFPIKMGSLIPVGPQDEAKPKKFQKRKAAAKPRPAAPVPAVNFDGDSFTLCRSAKNAAGVWVNEYYLPADEDLDKWNRLLGVYYYDAAHGGPVDIAQSMIDTLKAANPAASYGVSQDEKKGEVIFDYFTWTPGNAVIEFNAFKITTYAGKPITLQFAQRWYDDGTGRHERDFMENFKTQRPKWVAAITAAPVPAPYKTEIKTQ